MFQGEQSYDTLAERLLLRLRSFLEIEKMSDQSLVFLVVDSVVAIGTLALAILTVSQLRLLIRERKGAQARELAERVYTPLRMEVSSWSDPEKVYAGFSTKTWSDLKQKVPYLTLRVPRDLTNILDEVERLYPRFDFLVGQVRGMIFEEAKRLGRELGAQVGITKEGWTDFRIVVKKGPFLNFDIASVWIRKMTLLDWARDFMETHYPIGDWEVEVRFADVRAGGTEESVKIAENVLQFMNTQPLARELLGKIEEIGRLGGLAIARIDQGLSRPVAPWG